jgi:hypothetical protein
MQSALEHLRLAKEELLRADRDKVVTANGRSG